MSRRSLLAVATAVVLSLFGAACGGNDDDGAATTEADAGGSTGSTGGEGAPGGRFVYGYESALTNMDPDLANVGQDNSWLFPAYDRLVHLTPEGDFIPGLAESWEFSDDGLTLTFHLREGVVFHDGSPLTAEVVKMNLERSQTLEGSVNASAIGAIESVEVVDDLTVQLNLTEPAASLIGILSDKPGIIISGQALRDGVDLSSQMVGAGMYRLVSYQQGDRAVFEKFEDYWDADSVLLDELVMVELLDPTARLNALRDGQIDAARILPDGIAAAEGAGFVVDRNPTLEVIYIPFRLAEGEPWTDQRVREALTYAIDKQAILDALYQGAGTIVSQMFPPGYFAASPDVPPDSRPYDPERAKELLAEAGYADGFDIALGVTPTTSTTLAQAVQAAWAEVGVNLELKTVTQSELVQKWFDAEFDIFLGPWSGRPDPNVTNDLLFSAESTFINAAGYDVPRINELLAQSEAATGEERTKLLQELSAVTDEVAFNIPLFALDFLLAKDPKVQGLEIYATSKIEFRGVSIEE